jgi:hypothetical protein
MFKSFFMGGFECSMGWNSHGRPIDQIAATQHDRFLHQDYRLLKEAGLYVAREGVRWPLIDREGEYDFDSLQRIIDASNQHGIELIYDLFHFGFPEDIDLFSPDFISRFADYCFEVARCVLACSDGPYYFTPVNEPSYFAWAAGEAGLFAPYATGRGPELKRLLIQAAIQGINAIRAVCPSARFVNADSLCRVVAPPGNSQLEWEAHQFNSVAVFESWDMLCGREHPEYGGSTSHLDIIGINYYWTNQWQIDRRGIPLAEDDPRRWPLHKLVRSVSERYDADLVVSETSHINDMRASWMHEVVRETRLIQKQNLPLHGICLYPILGMPEWHDEAIWTRMGLWDLVEQDGILQRVPYMPMMDALQKGQRRLQKERI